VHFTSYTGKKKSPLSPPVTAHLVSKQLNS